MSKEKYILTQDDSSDWYVIPQSKELEWDKFFKEPEYPYKDLPEWAESVGGSPSLVVFKDYEIL